MKLSTTPVTTSQPPQITNAHSSRSAQLPARGEIYPEGEREQRNQQQPGDLVAHLGGEQSMQPGTAAERGQAGTAAAPAADLAIVAEDAVRSVVAQRQFEHGVVGRTADVGSCRRRHQLHYQHPPAGRDDKRGRRTHQMKDPPWPRGRRHEQVGQREAGQHQKCLQHLGEECEADHHTGQRQPSP